LICQFSALDQALALVQRHYLFSHLSLRMAQGLHRFCSVADKAFLVCMFSGE